MASRAEAAAVARWPAVGSAIRAALGDFYVNSLRMVPANLVWAATLIGVWLAFLVAPLGFLLLPLLAFPTASIFRIAVLVVRGGPLSLWDGVRVWRTDPGPILVLGIVLVSCLALFLVNIVSGVRGGGVIGWVVATCAAWGAVVAWLVSWTAWPLLLDPCRADRPVRERLRIGSPAGARLSDPAGGAGCCARGDRPRQHCGAHRTDDDLGGLRGARRDALRPACGRPLRGTNAAGA